MAPQRISSAICSPSTARFSRSTSSSTRYTGKAKGFGFVEMTNDEEARAAIEALNGFEFMGRQLRVNEAEDKPRRDSNFRPRRY